MVSGPGAFPTGNSIKFEAGSDIRIVDGQASIEFRSCYAGNTIIEASSPGLEPVQLHLRFTGTIPYRKDITPVPVQRQYVRFTKKTQTDIFAVSGIKISFPGKETYQYKVEIADNSGDWKVVADLMNNESSEEETKLDVSQTVGRWIRIRFKNADKASLSEVQVTGKVLE